MNYKAVRGHSKNCRGVIYWFNPPRSLGSHRLSEIDTYPVQTPPRSKRASGRSAAPWTQSSAHWTFSSGPFLDPTFSVRSIKTKTFQRDHLLHNKEATCPVHVGKKHNWWELLPPPAPLNHRRKSPKHQITGKTDRKPREVSVISTPDKQTANRRAGQSCSDPQCTPKDMRCIAHFKLRGQNITFYMISFQIARNISFTSKEKGRMIIRANT